jgi:hypothetical protein
LSECEKYYISPTFSGAFALSYIGRPAAIDQYDELIGRAKPSANGLIGN